jgi:hypothetical protein
MWDIFIAFLLIGMGAFLAIFELTRWFKTKRWMHLLVVGVAVLSELAITFGFLYALVLLVFALVLLQMIMHTDK